jgi:hypothetical protein
MTLDKPYVPIEVIFSGRAHAAICAETMEHHPLETGGILLGHFYQHRWQVIEAIDPGLGARCTSTTFEYDRAYVNHLAHKLARQYRLPLRLIGLWHRHPNSFDNFSKVDDITNRRFASTSIHGALSCLVNLDPDFRLTAYHVPKDLSYQRLPAVVGDGLIDSSLLTPICAADISPKKLNDQDLALDLQQLFIRLPRAHSALQLKLANALDPFLHQLDVQKRWLYGLRACGHCLQLALVEQRGPCRELWELALCCSGLITALRDDGLRLNGSQFSDHLLEVNHGC